MGLFGPGGSVSWIIVFLGNPGEKYDGSRHNMGFLTATELEKREKLSINRLRFKAKTAQATLGGQKVLLMKPQTFMNLSGDAVQEAKAFYKVPLDHILVISDDVSLKPGQIRIKRGGSSGGHNGLKDIAQKCGGEGFPRIKIGVGSPEHPEYEMIDWVLGHPQGPDKEAISKAIDRAADAIPYLIENGVDKTMNKYNSNL